MTAEPTTVVADPSDTLFQARTHIAREMNTAYELINRAGQALPNAVYKDPSALGADRARLNLAARLVNEVGCRMVDLTFEPSVDSGEEG